MTQSRVVRTTGEAVLAAAALGLIVSMALTPSSHATLTAAVVLEIPYSEDGCVDCQDGDWCEAGYHDAWNNPAHAPWTRNGGAHSGENPCWSGTCETRHGPECTLTLPTPLQSSDLEQLRVAVANSDANATAALQRDHSQQLSVNESRSAIQIVDCRGSVFAHLPVSESLIASLTATQRRGEALASGATRRA